MRETGLFGLSDHLKWLSVCGDSLEELGTARHDRKVVTEHRLPFTGWIPR